MSSNKRRKLKAMVATDDYVEGSVIRIMLEDFLTYDSVEFRPGPHLNVIIGPNGTGKSTIVCALCLGLAGKPALLGRANALADFIKHGCQKAVIEIELVNKDGENYVIRREIGRNNTSQWSVNGRNAPLKAVEETVARLHIQVGNLCQFLPQDKVADFAKMGPTELLESTEKAVGPADMFNNHMRLKTARETGRKLELDVSNTTTLLDQEIQKNQRLEQDIKNYEEREQHLKKISDLKMKRPWVEYSAKREEYTQQKQKREAMQTQVEAARKQQAPLRARLEQAKKKLGRLDQQIRNKSDAIRLEANEAANKSNLISKCSEKAQEIYDHLQERTHQERERLNKVAELERHRQSLESDLASLTTEAEDMAPHIEKCNQDMRRVNRTMTQLQQQAENLQRDRGHARGEISSIQKQLQQVQDVSNQRLDMVRRCHRDTYNAIQWLRANTHRFQGTIHEPIMTVINMKDPRFARYVEAHISFNDMRAFVCENEADARLFLEMVRDEQRLKVNCVRMPKEQLDSFKPTKPLGAYKQFGFHSYMKDLFDCPEAVMRYLCLMYKVHKIPIGSNHTKQRVEQVTEQCPELTNFYTENHRYSIKRSKYNPNITSSRCTELKMARLLTVTHDQQRENALREDLASKQADLTRLEDEYKKSQQQSKQQEAEMNKLRQDKQALMHKRDQRRSIQQKIAVKTQNIERLQGERIDMDAEKNKVARKIHDNNVKMSTHLKEFRDHIQQCANLGTEKVRFGMQHTQVQQEVQEVEGELREGSSHLQNIEREYEIVKERTKTLLATAKRSLEEARKAIGKDNYEDLPQRIQEEFRNLPDTLEEIDASIHEVQARADCTMPADANVVNEYRRRKREIEKLTTDAARKKADLKQHQEEIEEIKEAWLEPLKELIGRINENFSFFFSSMKCAGEVDLSVPENPEDYEKYGVQIKVKFRDNEQLRELTPFHQSGGERSVATVLYMMALQELTKCPFRCVDEINQGMDPQNERKVFELVVKTVCQRNTSQYFLLTPKLLPDLDYSDSMTILCIYNGSHMVDHTQWNLRNFLGIRSRFSD